MEQIFKAINVYFSFTAVAINAVLIMLVLVRTSRTTAHITFLFLCFAAIVWNFGVFMTYVVGEGFWHYVSRIGSPLLPALLFHFAHSLVRPASRSNWIKLAYILSGLLSLSSFLAIIDPGIKLFVDSSFWNLYFLGALYPFILGGIGILQGEIRHAQSSEQRNRLRYFQVATLIGMLTGLTDLIQIYHSALPRLGHIGSVLYPSVIAIGILRHRQSYDILAQLQIKLAFLHEIAAGLAHEIRNPLSSIKGAGKLLSAELTPDRNSKVREYLDIILEEVVRLNDILDNFQNLAKPLNVIKEPLAIDHVITKTIQLAEVAALPMEITTSLPADLPSVKADASSLKQVFLNLIKNAAEAGSAECKLKIAMAYVPPCVKITFLDNGGGIPPEILDHIFEPFFTTKASGMGMGLAISRRIVQAHDGRIEVRNVKPAGAEVAIFLPA